MKSNSFTMEQSLLCASGLIAIGTVALVSYSDGSNALQNLALQLIFAALFVINNYDKELGLPPVYGQLMLVVMLLLSFMSLLLYQDTLTLILAVVIMASAPYHFTARQSWALFVLANLIYWYLFSSVDQAGAYQLGFLTLVALQGFAISSSQARQRDMASQRILERQNNELLAARAVMARQGQAQERLRIAGELHDTIGHGLTALQLQLEALAYESPAALTPQVQSCKSVAADLLEEVRSIVREVPSRDANDLAGALRELEALTPGIQIHFNADLPPLSVELSQQLIFCFQEAIHNAIRHGGATRVDIDYLNGAFEISDNGLGLRGGRIATPGFGLRNIGNRLAPFGGSALLEPLEVEPGCKLTLKLAQLKTA
ncbi:MAG: sensor histidine kinase [Congregibacter sp.]